MLSLLTDLERVMGTCSPMISRSMELRKGYWQAAAPAQGHTAQESNT